MSIIPKVPQVLCMIPYPSGQLHFGHFRIFTLGSTISKYKQLREGSKIFFPLGFDSFGLPAETASMKSGKEPLEYTENNISEIIGSLKKFGIEFSDYTDDSCIDGGVVLHDRVPLTTEFANPQRLLQTHTEAYYTHTQSLFLKLYKAGLIVKKLGIVDYDPVLKTTIAAQEINGGKSSRSGASITSILAPMWYVTTTKYASKLYSTPSTYPTSISTQQKNWIGPIDGHEIDIQVGIKNNYTYKPMKAFITSDPTFIICPVTHPLWNMIDPILKSNFLSKRMKRLSGFNTGLVGVIGDVAYDIYVAPGLELSSGMLSFGSKNDPGHAEFMKVHSIKQPKGNPKFETNTPKTIYKMKDWCVSRQRKWGTPIPIVNCPSCGPVPLPESSLPLTLANQSCKTTCPNCSSPSDYEKDTLDTFFDSSFYFLHLPQPYKPSYKSISPVDLYIGGPEHATLHLLFARFITKVLFDLGHINFDEPFKELLVSGIVKSVAYKNQLGKYTTTPGPKDTKVVEKMSKSKGNGVDPSVLVDKYGAGVVRLFVLSRCHPTVDWVYDEWGVQGPIRFVEKLKQVCETVFEENSDKVFESKDIESDKLDEDTAVMVGKVQREMDSMALHSVVTIFYGYLKHFEKFLDDIEVSADSRRRNLKKFLVVCYPFLDTTVSEIWNKYFKDETMVWPKAGTRKLTEWKVFVNNRELELEGDRMDFENVLKEINYKYPKDIREKMIVNKLKRVVIIEALN